MYKLFTKHGKSFFVFGNLTPAFLSETDARALCQFHCLHRIVEPDHSPIPGSDPWLTNSTWLVNNG